MFKLVSMVALLFLSLAAGCSPGSTSSATAGAAPPASEALEQTFPPGETSDFTFKSSGLTLSGILDVPDGGKAKALILLVHSYGGSNVRDPNAYSAYTRMRQRLNEIGIATAVWDKPGQGESEGKFDIDQPVASSGEEVVDAARYLRAVNAPGSDKIGVWGGSRAGWIAPIAMAQDAEIEFWISISGTSIEDNFTYLLLSNLPYEGGSPELAAQFAGEWRAGCEILRTGGSYKRYQEATEALRANEYIREMRGDWPSRLEYWWYQRPCKDGSCPSYDDDMCSYVPVDGFEAMLASLDVDVLAIFGAKDLNVDWRKTRALYEATIGQNPEASLAVEVFADADHALNVAETGSIREMRANAAPRKSDGYYATQIAWLERHVVGSRNND